MGIVKYFVLIYLQLNLFYHLYIVPDHLTSLNRVDFARLRVNGYNRPPLAYYYE